MISKEKLMETMLELVSVPGISGTESENLTAKKIYDILSEFPYFKEHENNLQLINIDKDPYNRCFVSALFCSKKETKKTIVLTGHFDVVGIEEFGHLKDLAFNPVELTKRIKELGLSPDALKDLESGDWLFGRGVADMKFGIALEIEILRYLSEKDDFKGNILLLAVPSEESCSEGMLGAVPYLVHLQEDLGYEFTTLLLSECSISGADDSIKYVYTGSVGKINPLFFFAGKETHVHEPFTGLNTNLLASEVNRLFELNVDFCESYGGTTTTPPTCLKQNDLKELYSVQTPIYAAAYYNLLTLNLDPEEIIEKLKKLCTEAFENVLESVNKKLKQFEKLSNKTIINPNFKPHILTYSELYNEVKNIYGEEFDLLIKNKVEMWQKQKMDNQMIAINIIKETYEKYPHKLPAIVIAFAPPYYPDRAADLNNENVRVLHGVIDKTIEYAETRYHEKINKESFFMGICDLSYTGVTDEKKINDIAANMIGLGLNYIFPVDSLKKLNIPVVNLGGLGKDFHKYSERLNIPYSFDVIPDLYMNIIYSLFS